MKLKDSSYYGVLSGNGFKGHINHLVERNTHYLDGQIYRIDSNGKLSPPESHFWWTEYLTTINDSNEIVIEKILREENQQHSIMSEAVPLSSVVYTSDDSRFYAYVLIDWVNEKGFIIEKYDDHNDIKWRKEYVLSDQGYDSIIYINKKIVPISDGENGVFIAFQATDKNKEKRPYYLWLDSDGNSKKIELNQSSINEQFFNQIELFPNPVSDFLNIRNDDKSIKQYCIYNILGKRVQSGEMRQSIDVNNLKDNMYFLHIEGKDGNLLKYRFEKSK